MRTKIIFVLALIFAAPQWQLTGLDGSKRGRHVDVQFVVEPVEPVEIDAGDDVSPAVATYTIDHSGTMFEVHSPRTEVPRLQPPSS